MVTLSVILYILGMIFCVIFAARSLDEQKNVAGDIIQIKQDMETFMATVQELQTIASNLQGVVSQVKVIVDDLKANSVSPTDLDPVAATLNEALGVLNSIVTPPV